MARLDTWGKGRRMNSVKPKIIYGRGDLGKSDKL